MGARGFIGGVAAFELSLLSNFLVASWAKLMAALPCGRGSKEAVLGVRGTRGVPVSDE